MSISYGGDEYEMGQQYVERCNQEFGKLALMGITILASSGDSGTRGDDNDCYRGELALRFSYVFYHQIGDQLIHSSLTMTVHKNT